MRKYGEEIDAHNYYVKKLSKENKNGKDN